KSSAKQRANSEAQVPYLLAPSLFPLAFEVYIMNRKLLIIAFAFILLAATSAALAQARATQRKPQTTTAQPSAVNVPVGKVAAIFSVAFQGPQAGIGKFGDVLSQVHAQFEQSQE